MSGKAKAKSRYESVGKPGIFEAASRPLALMEKNIIGKSSAEIVTAGCLMVRTVERRASAATCVSKEGPPTTEPPPSRRLRLRLHLPASVQSSPGRRRRGSARRGGGWQRARPHGRERAPRRRG